MGRIKITRGNDYVSNIATVIVNIEKENYELNSNSSVIHNSDGNLVVVKAKHLWVSSMPTTLVDTHKYDYTVNIRPLINNKILFISFSFLFALILMYVFIDSSIIELLLAITGISFLIIMLSLITFLKNRYFSLSVKRG